MVYGSNVIMTKEEFETLQVEHSQRGKTLKVFLNEEGVSYGICHYWLKKKENAESMCGLAPIRFAEEAIVLYKQSPLLYVVTSTF